MRKNYLNINNNQNGLINHNAGNTYYSMVIVKINMYFSKYEIFMVNFLPLKKSFNYYSS